MQGKPGRGGVVRGGGQQAQRAGAACRRAGAVPAGRRRGLSVHARGGLPRRRLFCAGELSPRGSAGRAHPSDQPGGQVQRGKVVGLALQEVGQRVDGSQGGHWKGGRGGREGAELGQHSRGWVPPSRPPLDGCSGGGGDGGWQCTDACLHPPLFVASRTWAWSLMHRTGKGTAKQRGCQKLTWGKTVELHLLLSRAWGAAGSLGARYTYNRLADAAGVALGQRGPHRADTHCRSHGA
jgi:hypothetical protein